MEDITILLISVGGTLIAGLGGALIGAVVAPKLNHNYKMQQLEKEHEKKIDYMKKEIVFQKKIKFFEEFSAEISEEILFYLEIIEDIKDGKKINDGEGGTMLELNLKTKELLDRGGSYLDFYKILNMWDNFSNIESKIDFILKNKNPNKNIKKLERLYHQLLEAKVEVMDELRKELEIE